MTDTPQPGTPAPKTGSDLTVRFASGIAMIAVALLVVTPVGASPLPHADLLSGLFDLTPAESRVAAALASGLTTQDHAANLDISRETVRSQLKSVVKKTVTARQAELIRLLASASPLPKPR